MSFAGFKKQLNKVNQFVAEKVGNAESTAMDAEFTRMEERFNTTCVLVEDLQSKTVDFLQPNPGARAIVATAKGISTITGRSMDSTYPQPEFALAEVMVSHGSQLGDDSGLGLALVQTGETMKQLSTIKFSLENNVKKEFLDPLHQMETKELKEVTLLKKKLESRRLDYDGKRRRLNSASSSYRLNDEELKVAEEKFEESLQLAQVGMHNILMGETEEISHLMTFAERLLEYHRQCAEVLADHLVKLKAVRDEAESRPKSVFVPKTLAEVARDEPPPPYSPGGAPPPYSPTTKTSNPRPVPRRTFSLTPSCTALYDFPGEKPVDLPFETGDKITLIKHLDEFWFEGKLNGRTGFLPKNFVQVDVPLP